MAVRLSRRIEDRWERVGSDVTDDDGRTEGFPDLEPGVYRLGFETGEWGNDFYPLVHVVFSVVGTRGHYHVPLLLSAFGYTTYLGS
jgi:5-hydroxyisourate hydrolase